MHWLKVTNVYWLLARKVLLLELLRSFKDQLEIWHEFSRLVNILVVVFIWYSSGFFFGSRFSWRRLLSNKFYVAQLIFIIKIDWCVVFRDDSICHDPVERGIVLYEVILVAGVPFNFGQLDILFLLLIILRVFHWVFTILESKLLI